MRLSLPAADSKNANASNSSTKSAAGSPSHSSKSSKQQAAPTVMLTCPMRTSNSGYASYCMKPSACWCPPQPSRPKRKQHLISTNLSTSSTHCWRPSTTLASKSMTWFPLPEGTLGAATNLPQKPSRKCNSCGSTRLMPLRYSINDNSSFARAVGAKCVTRSCHQTLARHTRQHPAQPSKNYPVIRPHRLASPAKSHREH